MPKFYKKLFEIVIEKNSFNNFIDKMKIPFIDEINLFSS